MGMAKFGVLWYGDSMGCLQVFYGCGIRRDWISIPFGLKYNSYGSLENRS